MKKRKENQQPKFVYPPRWEIARLMAEFYDPKFLATRYANQCVGCNSWNTVKSGSARKGYQRFRCNDCNLTWHVKHNAPMLPDHKTAWPCPHCGNPATNQKMAYPNGRTFRICNRCKQHHTAEIPHFLKHEKAKPNHRFIYERTSDGSENPPIPVTFRNFNDFHAWIVEQCGNPLSPDNPVQGVIITPMSNGRFHLEIYDDFRE